MDRSSTRKELRLLAVSFLTLLTMSTALALSSMVRTGSWTAEFKAAFFIPLAAWCAAAAGLRLWLRRRLPQHDPLLLPAVMLLTGWGLLMIWRLDPGAGLRQSIWLLLGAGAAAVIIRFAAHINHLQEYRLVWLTTGLLLTGLTLLFGTNPSGGEPNLWFRLLGVYVQPSEPLRLILVIYLAAYYARNTLSRQELFIHNPAAVTPIIIIFGLSISLLILQRDLGTAILFAGVLTLMLYLATRRWQIFIAAGLVLLAAGAAGYLLYDVVRIRIEAWLFPWQDPSGASYQIVQALIAFASGGISGTGAGLGSPGFVPAAHTDFIYTAVGEEFGFLGTILLITVYLVFLSRGLKISALQKDPFNRMLASGIVVTIGMQALLIMGGNVRLLPLTGVTLPYMSYGGSSLLTSFAAFGILMCMSAQAARRPVDPTYRHVQIGFMAGFTLLALFTGWWSVIRSPSLLSREDNYRGFVESRYQERGAILDRSGRVLVSSAGEPGSIQRTTLYQSFSPLVGYDSNQLGQSGLEQSLDPFLRGLYGYSELELTGSYLLDGTSPGGLNIRLTLDLELQEAIYELLQFEAGAAVILDSTTGSVRALVSSPSFDINTLEQDWDELINREDAPLFNRPVQGSYQPGTALSPLLMAWHLQESGQLDSAPAVDYTGTVQINGMELNCARTITIKPGDLPSAVRAGCPRASIALGTSMGEEGLQQALKAFGLTSDLQMRLPENHLTAPELPVTLRSVEEFAAGQGALTVSPLRLSRAAAALQTGHLPPLHVVDSVHLPDGTREQLDPLGLDEQVLSADTVEKISDLYYLEQNPSMCFTGQALTGTDMESIAWITCLVQDPVEAVLTIVLEDSLPSEAILLSREILALPAFSSP